MVFVCIGTSAIGQDYPNRPTKTAYSDVTAGSGTAFLHTGFGIADKFQGTGAAWFDFDQDGDLDLYVTRRIGANALFQNNGDGTFTDVAGPRGAADASHDGAGVAVGDYDNDGWPDVYLANSREDVLLRNVGGHFVDVTELTGITTDGSRGTTASWGDFDNNGWLDLYVTNHAHIELVAGAERDRLLRSNGDGTFSDVTHLLPTNDISGYGFIGAWSDYDADGDSDLFLVNDCPLDPTSTKLFRNDGDDRLGGWLFSEVSTELGAGHCAAGMGLAVGDYNRDGLLDYFYTNIGPPVLLRNGTVGFDFVTFTAGLKIGTIPGTRYERFSWGANFLDYDNDGWLDLYVASGAMRQVASINPQQNVLMHNVGDGTFKDVTFSCGAADVDRSRTSVIGDYDGDGDLDIYVVNYEEPCRLYRNDNANGNHYLVVDLEGVASNRDGIGAWVRIRTKDGAYQYREVRSGSSLGGGDDVAAYFGTCRFGTVVELIVLWPSGLAQVLHDVASNQRITLVEDGSTTAARITEVVSRVQGGRVAVDWVGEFEVGIAEYRVERMAPSGWVRLGAVSVTPCRLKPTARSWEGSASFDGMSTLRVSALDAVGNVIATSHEFPIAIPSRSPVLNALGAAYPNPVAGRSTMSLSANASQEVVVDLFDVRGRRVAELFSGNLLAGETRLVSVDAGRLASGIYFVRATGSEFAATRKIVVHH